MMTEAKTKPTDLSQYYFALKDRWLPWIKVTLSDDDQENYAVRRAGQWIDSSANELPALTVFATVVILLPASVCAYRMRHFPKHMVTAKELGEAVALDFPHWSPWGSESNYCFNYEAQENEWVVAIWVWDRHYAQTMQQRIPFCTHIIPELAWYAAIAPQHPALLIAREQNLFNYLLLGEAGKLIATAHISTPQQAKRCWHGWGLPEITQGWEINHPEGYWAPETVTMQALPNLSVPHDNLLRITRIPEVRDWIDPSNYYVVIRACLLLIFSWMLVDGMILNHQAQKIQEQLNLIQNSANEVLALREQLESSQSFHQHVVNTQRKQLLLERVLAQLSIEIPKDIYLKTVHYEGDELDLEGQGNQVARLMVLLEKLEDVEKVILTNDIRSAGETNEEFFQIRLILKHL